MQKRERERGGEEKEVEESTVWSGPKRLTNKSGKGMGSEWEVNGGGRRYNCRQKKLYPFCIILFEVCTMHVLKINNIII